MNGILYVVATPIGNLSDISPRAVETLRSVDIILAEDTRVTGYLCSHFGITAPIRSYHKFSEKRLLHTLISQLSDGSRIALVSDAGTPAVSDPGKYLIKEALAHHIQVVPLPGPSAAITAFSVSGADSDEFIFAGFLPSKGEQRIARLDELCAHSLPIVLYEAPHRIASLLELLHSRASRIVVCRELTKQFEEIFVWNGEPVTERGEFVVVAEPLSVSQPIVTEEETAVKLVKSSGLKTKDKITLLQKIYPTIKPNEAKRLLYSHEDTP